MCPGPEGRAVRCSSVELYGTMVRLGAAGDAGVPRERIRRIALVHDTASRYPFVRFFAGFVLAAVGGMGVVVQAFASLRGSLPFDSDSGQVVVNVVPLVSWLMVALGVWSLLGVFRTTYKLVIETDEGISRTVMGTSTDLPDIRRFVRMARWSFGYEIDTPALDGQAEPR